METWNVKRSFKKSSLKHLYNKCIKCYFDIVQPQVAKQQGNDINELRDFIFFYGESENRITETECLVSKAVKAAEVNFQVLSERVCKYTCT